MRKIGIIIQARRGSTRFPDKVFALLKGKTIIEHVVENAKNVWINPIIVATPGLEEDREIQHYLPKDVKFVQYGCPGEVLNRVIFAAEKYNLKDIIRVCADNPYLNSYLLHDLIATWKINDCDYAGYWEVEKNCPAIKTKTGLYAEIVKIEALKDLARHEWPDQISCSFDSHPYQEHVTLGIYERNYKCLWLPAYNYGRNYSIDTPEDLERVRKYE